MDGFLREWLKADNSRCIKYWFSTQWRVAAHQSDFCIWVGTNPTWDGLTTDVEEWCRDQTK